jgi:hypothetical protein
MVAKKKTVKKKTRAKKAGSKRAKPAKRLTKRTPPARKKSAKKKAVKKKAIKRSSATKKKAAARQTASRRTGRDTTAPFAQEISVRSGGQSGDLQGLSGVERADSESVDELLEEGNAFEAGIVSGVEDAGNADEGEVRTREVPEDDVPGEYLDED